MANNPESKPAVNEQAVFEAANNPYRSTREFIETLAIALFLAMTFKFFEAEAYVIPTGSMATTLMGRHKDVRCQACGYPFQVSASEERDRQNRATNSSVIGGTCPQCRLSQKFQAKDISFSGDRVLVNKFIGDFRPIRRWEVTVFRSPPDPQTNYIKRFVGLPHENIRIQYGNLYAQKVDDSGNPSGEFEILRKPLRNLMQMLRIVYDNDYQPRALLELGWPPRWQDESAFRQTGTADWQSTDDGRNFYYSGEAVADSPKTGSELRVEPADRPELPGDASYKWLRYRHIIPTSSQWVSFAGGSVPSGLKKDGVIPDNPQLITDMNAYNTSETAAHPSLASMGFNWTGELALSLTVTPYAPKGDSASMVLELVQGGTPFRAKFDFLRGAVSLEIPTVPEYEPETVSYPFEPNKAYRILFVNADEQLRVAVNGKELAFPHEGKYDRLCSPLSGIGRALLPRNRDPNALDLTPVSIGTDMPAKVEHLKIMRDTYYIALGNHLEEIAASSPDAADKHLYKFGARDPFDHLFGQPFKTEREESAAHFYATPALWESYGNTRSALIELRDDQYLALGDNSSNSEDCRSWGHPDPNWADNAVPPYVDRELVLGKAVSVYWPHGKLIPGTRLPFIPNFGKMRRID